MHDKANTTPAYPTFGRPHIRVGPCRHIDILNHRLQGVGPQRLESLGIDQRVPWYSMLARESPCITPN